MALSRLELGIPVVFGSTRYEDVSSAVLRKRLRPSESRQKPPPVPASYLPFGYAHWGQTFFSAEALSPYNSEPVDVFAVKGGVLLGTDGVILGPDNVIVGDPRFIRYGSNHSFFPMSVGHNLATPLNHVQLHGRAFLGFTPAYRNYSHWLSECVPLLYLYARGDLGPDVGLLLPSEAADPGTFQGQYVDLLGIERAQIHYVSHRTAVHCDTIECVRQLEIWNAPPVVREAAEWLLRHGVVDACSEEWPYVWISRGQTSSRLLLNEGELLTSLIDLGFRPFELERMAVAAQIRLFSSARIIAGTHGAGLTNVIFASRGAHLLEVCGEFFLQPHFWSFAALAGAKYGYFAGTSFDQEDFRPGSWDAPFVVDSARLHDQLELMMTRRVSSRWMS